MRRIGFIICICSLVVGFTSCSDNRIFETNYSFEQRYWHIDSVKNFGFSIKNRSVPSNIYLNVRNSSDYPFYNIYVRYTIQDSLGNILSDSLANKVLFNSKTGRPLGQSGIGDVFDHQFLLEEDFVFPYRGNFNIVLKQYMRTDSLKGVLSAGIRVENSAEIN